MPKLNDTQTLLLGHASRDVSGSFYPLPETHARAGARVIKALSQLVNAGFADERETNVAAQTHREDGDLRFGMYVTSAGLKAIGVEPTQKEDAEGQRSTASTLPDQPPRQTKAGNILALLQRSEGATLAELVEATGWLPHTTRAALTGLRKKGHHLVKDKHDGDHLLSDCQRVSALAAELAGLDRLSPYELRARWSKLTSGPCPKVSPLLLRLALAWELQARAMGGHSRETTRLLNQLEAGKTRTTAAASETRLVREWNGKAHVVTIDEDSRIIWNGRHWNSLSEVAREITGTRWSGPAFFGLRKNAA